VERWGFPPFKRPWRARARRTEGEFAGQTVVVLKPQTYMNRSGAALSRLRVADDFDPAQHLLVVVDEVQLPVGTFRMRARGSAGGHNGLRSIEGALQSQEYARLRIGVGPAGPIDADLADFVLGPFEPEERHLIDDLLPTVAEAVECWITDGTETAMNRYNQLGKAE